MRPPSPAGGPTHTSIVSYTLHWLPDWGHRLTQAVFKFDHTAACTRRRNAECGKPKRIRKFSHPLRSIVTRLITAPCKSSSGRRKLYLVLQYCLFHVPNPDLHIISFATALARGLCARPQPERSIFCIYCKNSRRCRCSEGP